MPADSTCQGEGLSDPIPGAQQHEMRTAIATKAPAPPISSTSVHRLIEIAREGPGGAYDPTVVALLEAEMTRIWAKLSKEPDTYVLSHDEFAVFNFFQFRSAVSEICRGARKRYWKQQALEHGDVKPSQDASQLPKDEAEDGSDEWTFIRRQVSRKRFAEPGLFAQFFDHELMKSVIDPIQVSILYSDQLPDDAFYTPSSSTYGYEISRPHSHSDQEGRSFTAEDAARQQDNEDGQRSLLSIISSILAEGKSLPVRRQSESLANANHLEIDPESPSYRSSSDSDMSMLSSTTESKIAATLLTTEGTQDILNKLLSFFTRVIELKLGITEPRQHGDFSSGGNTHAWQRSAPLEPSQSQSIKGKGKRPLRAGDDFDDFDEAPDDGEPEAKRNKPDKPKIACPYMKRFPAEFRTWRTCVGPGFDGMNRMKEHLKRKHFKENGCHRCGLHLESNQALQEHLRSIDICPIREILPQMGFMNQTQWCEISKKRQIQMTPLQERWKEIYLILFPEVDESSIPGPYFEDSEISDGMSNIFDPREFEGFLKQQLPARLLTNMNREFQLFSEIAKLKLAEMLKEESLAILKAYVLQKGGRSVQISEKPAQSSGTEAFDTRVLDSGLFDTIETFGDEGQGEIDLSILDVYYQQSEKGQGSEKAGLGHDSSVM